MQPREFFINPADYGLPTRDELVAYRIWDTHFQGFYGGGNPIAQFRTNNFYVERRRQNDRGRARRWSGARAG